MTVAKDLAFGQANQGKKVAMSMKRLLLGV